MTGDENGQRRKQTINGLDIAAAVVVAAISDGTIGDDGGDDGQTTFARRQGDRTANKICLGGAWIFVANLFYAMLTHQAPWWCVGLLLLSVIMTIPALWRWYSNLRRHVRRGSKILRSDASIPEGNDV